MVPSKSGLSLRLGCSEFNGFSTLRVKLTITCQFQLPHSENYQFSVGQLSENEDKGQIIGKRHLLGAKFLDNFNDFVFKVFFFESAIL
jgi:hypothetical protein